MSWPFVGAQRVVLGAARVDREVIAIAMVVERVQDQLEAGRRGERVVAAQLAPDHPARLRVEARDAEVQRLGVDEHAYFRALADGLAHRGILLDEVQGRLCFAPVRFREHPVDVDRSLDPKGAHAADGFGRRACRAGSGLRGCVTGGQAAGQQQGGRGARQRGAPKPNHSCAHAGAHAGTGQTARVPLRARQRACSPPSPCTRRGTRPCRRRSGADGRSPRPWWPGPGARTRSARRRSSAQAERSRPPGRTPSRRAGRPCPASAATAAPSRPSRGRSEQPSRPSGPCRPSARRTRPDR